MFGGFGKMPMGKVYDKRCRSRTEVGFWEFGVQFKKSVNECRVIL